MKNAEASPALSPGNKKLVQARLPFKVVSPASTPALDIPLTSRKRKFEGDVVNSSNSKNNENRPICGDTIENENGAVNSSGDVSVVIDLSSDGEQKSETPRRTRPKKNVKVGEKTKTSSPSKLNVSPPKQKKKPKPSLETVETKKITSPSASAVTPKQKRTPKIALKTEAFNEITSPVSAVTPKQKMTPSEAALETEEINENTSPSASSVTPKQKRKPKAALETVETNETTSPSASAVTPKKKRTPKTALATEEADENMSPSASVVTPKQKRTAKIAVESGETNENTSPSGSALTPKQLQRKLESAKKREQREQEKQEKERRLQQEKEERHRLKLEKEEQRRREKEEKEEQKRKEKEEKEEQKRKEREEKERQKELERKEKEEKEEQRRKEREEKEEQRRKEKEAREDERRKKQEAIEEEKRQKELERQEQEMKKKKAAAAFVNFFVPKQKAETEVPSTSKNNVLSVFTVKSDMRLAPMVRNQIGDEEKVQLVEKMEQQNALKSELYLQSLRDKVVKPKSCRKTWPLEENDCLIVESEDDLPPVVMGSGEVIVATATARERLRPKLLSFHENRRPPYWGTWRKKSDAVRPRRPFGTDNKHLDYEVDSDSEWEDEADGESIAGSVAGSVDEEKDEYEVDNDVFVPHGYLSDEEGTMDGEDVLTLSPETQKAKLKHLEDEFETEMKKPTEKLKPRIYGLIWETSDGGKPESCIDALWNYFGKMAMIFDDIKPYMQPVPQAEESEKKKVKRKKPEDNGSPVVEKKKRAKQAKETKADKTPDSKKQPGINTFLKKIVV